MKKGAPSKLNVKEDRSKHNDKGDRSKNMKSGDVSKNSWFSKESNDNTLI